MIFATGGINYALDSFSLGLGFIPIGFPGKVFNEEANKAYNNISVLFCPSLRFFPVRFFLSKVLMRHIIYQCSSKEACCKSFLWING